MVQLGSTTNFTFEYDESARSNSRPGLAHDMCQALMNNITEQDYGTLSGWFGSGALSTSNKCRVTVQRLDNALAANFGWRSDGTTQIIVSPVDSVSDAAVLTDETGVRLAAELSEVLSDRVVTQPFEAHQQDHSALFLGELGEGAVKIAQLKTPYLRGCTAQ